MRMSHMYSLPSKSSELFLMHAFISCSDVIANMVYAAIALHLCFLLPFPAVQGSREQDLGPVQCDHVTPRGAGEPEDLTAGGEGRQTHAAGRG